LRLQSAAACIVIGLAEGLGQLEVEQLFAAEVEDGEVFGLSFAGLGEVKEDGGFGCGDVGDGDEAFDEWLAAVGKEHGSGVGVGAADVEPEVAGEDLAGFEAEVDGLVAAEVGGGF